MVMLRAGKKISLPSDQPCTQTIADFLGNSSGKTLFFTAFKEVC